MKRIENEIYTKTKNNINMKNLSKLIKENKYSITKVAMNVGINDSTLYGYLNNTISPSITVLINIANFFKCNIDYLIGRTDTPTLHENYNKEEIKVIIEMLEKLTQEEKDFVKILISEINKQKLKDKINN